MKSLAALQVYVPLISVKSVYIDQLLTGTERQEKR